ncbi:hypothetical protein F2P81_015303 [Scophthalmus maximus]|uniref:Uncharacterized protein n=1 Tax=Scophthalmus maximus TaxID=52904 RepID=A0A6A4SFV0_SCOMX|nr:hypothetical protein F2P81_015303 [Scophthalmus maximus]
MSHASALLLAGFHWIRQTFVVLEHVCTLQGAVAVKRNLLPRSSEAVHHFSQEDRDESLTSSHFLCDNSHIDVVKDDQVNLR